MDSCVIMHHMNKDPFTTPLDQLSDDIALLSAHIDAAGARLMDKLVAFDLRGGWHEEGALSCVQWLGFRLGWATNTASERLRVGHALKKLPILHDALAQGRVSYSKLREVTKVAAPETDAEWLNIALNSTASQCGKIVRKCRHAEEAENLVVENARYDQRWLSTYWDNHGMLVVEGRLSPEVGAVVEKAIEAAMEEIRREEWKAEAASELQNESSGSAGALSGESVVTDEPRTTSGQRRADALGRVAERALHGEPAGKAADRNQVIVHVDLDVLADPESSGRAELENGPSLSAETLRRLTCDCSLVTMLHDANGKVLGAGRKTRVIPVRIQRALAERDKGCRFPGCSCSRTEGHHLEHWGEGGETELLNLLNLCSSHHRLVHEGGFTVELDDAGEVIFKNPDGVKIPRVVTPPAPRGDPVEVITGWNEEAGLRLEADTNMPEWDGETPQYDYIAEVMTDQISYPPRRIAAREVSVALVPKKLSAKR